MNQQNQTTQDEPQEPFKSPYEQALEDEDRDIDGGDHPGIMRDIYPIADEADAISPAAFERVVDIALDPRRHPDPRLRDFLRHEK